MGTAFEYRQAVIVWTNAAHQHVVAVEDEVLRGNGCCGVACLGFDPFHRIGGGDVFEHNS